jgi:hypothetical protein
MMELYLLLPIVAALLTFLLSCAYLTLSRKIRRERKLIDLQRKWFSSHTLQLPTHKE